MREDIINQLIGQLSQLTDKIQRDGGEVRVALDSDRWRKIHFVPGSSKVFILDRITSTVKALSTWHRSET